MVDLLCGERWVIAVDADGIEEEKLLCCYLYASEVHDLYSVIPLKSTNKLFCLS